MTPECSLYEMSGKFPVASYLRQILHQISPDQTPKVWMVRGTLRTTTNFFLAHRVKTTMPTNMTQVRSMLPARLRGARFATIAQDATYRRYFASGDDSATILGVLRRLYDASGNPRRSGTLDRQLESWRPRRSTICGNTPTVAAFAVPLARLISRRQRASRFTRWTSPPSTPHPLAPSSL